MFAWGTGVPRPCLGGPSPAKLPPPSIGGRSLTSKSCRRKGCPAAPATPGFGSLASAPARRTMTLRRRPRPLSLVAEGHLNADPIVADLGSASAAAPHSAAAPEPKSSECRGTSRRPLPARRGREGGRAIPGDVNRIGDVSLGSRRWRRRSSTRTSHRPGRMEAGRRPRLPRSPWRCRCGYVSRCGAPIGPRTYV